MNYKLSITIAILTSLLCGCDSKPISDAKKTLERDLKDSSSVQYRNVVETSDTVVCGEYNSKNSYGAYAGFSEFVYFSGIVYTNLSYEESELLCGNKAGKTELYLYGSSSEIYLEAKINNACLLANRIATQYDKDFPSEKPLEIFEWEKNEHENIHNKHCTCGL